MFLRRRTHINKPLLLSQSSSIYLTFAFSFAFQSKPVSSSYPHQHTSHTHTQSYHTRNMSPSSNNSTSNAKNEARSQGHKDEDIEGDHNDWKFRVPYKVHENDEDFKVLYEGGCHCGRVKYQLSRERPLSAKFCHCTTCQVLHGESFRERGRGRRR